MKPMRRTRYQPILLLSVITSALACSSGAITGQIDEPVDAVALDPLFAEAERETGVPADLLKAIAFTETRWSMVEGAEHDGTEPAHGVMGLRDERLARAAQLSGFDPEDLRHDERANLLAAAALLSSIADEQGVDRADLGDWAQAVGEFSGIEDADARRHYVVSGVYKALQDGATRVEEDGTLVASLEPREVTPDYPSLGSIFAASPDYARAVYRPSPNWNFRPAGAAGTPKMVIIHTCEGGYSGCWGWLRNTAAGASAHYVVSESGSEITQLVLEARRAWHLAATYSSSRNGGRLGGYNGVSGNHFTIGIEHAGFASQSSFPSGQIEASARLVCDITRDHKIPRDKYHVVGHGQLQPSNRTDPGRNWPWTHYLNRVRAHCGSGTSTPPSSGNAIIVDSNNARNDTDRAKIEVSSTWEASSSSSDFHGSGYYWASTEEVSDGAKFWFYLPTAGTKTIDAWWSAGENRSTSAPFVAFDANGEKLGSVARNQQVDGGQWNQLGSFAFTAGWNRVELSRWVVDDKVVVADAVRIR